MQQVRLPLIGWLRAAMCAAGLWLVASLTLAQEVTQPSAASPPSAVPPAAGPIVAPARGPVLIAPRLESLGSVTANVAGLLGFGLSTMLEFGGEHFGVNARMRFPQAGVISHFLWPNGDEKLGFSIAVGGGARFYVAERHWMSGFYVGPFIEWMRISVIDDEERKDEVWTYMFVAADLGYRWRFGAFLLGAGAVLGGAISLSAENHFRDDGTVEKRADGGSAFAAQLVADLGFAF